MNYPLKNSHKKHSKAPFVLIGLFLVVVLSLFLPFETPIFLRASAQRIARPVWRAQQFMEVRVSDLAALFKTKVALVKDNRVLQNQLAALKAVTIEHTLLQQEYKVLEGLLKRTRGDAQLVATARILSKPNRTPYDTLIIDQGSSAGVTVGDRVGIGTHVAIGSVANVFPRTALVTLFSSPGVSLPVLLGENALALDAHGLGNGMLRILLPHDITVAVGDPILLPGETPLYFGSVEIVRANPADSLQTLLFQSPVNIAELSWVSVLRDIPLPDAAQGEEKAI